jgi:Zn-dependent M28 family amino/carboxypeptidase
MKTLIYASILFSFCANAQSIQKKNLKQHISFLASDDLKGRGTSTEDEKKAADYIASEFKKLKLSPGNSLSYFYEFTYKKSTNPHDTGTADAPQKKGINVIGYLNNDAPNTIVIGAHYDHLGLGHDHNSLDANPEGKIHNGADDNASGTAGVLELANYFAGNAIKEKYNFLFMCFSGEELGLLGSKKWCDKPTIDLKSINYMINLDMIGRLNAEKKLVVYGVGTSPVWVPLMDSLKSEFSIKKDSSGIGPSDQTSFYLKDIPVLHFFTGQHSDYHKPDDDEAKINYDGEVAILNYITSLVEVTLSYPKLTFLKTRNPDSGKVSFKVTMGIMPDYTFEGKGLRIDGVTDGKPASKAGLQKGDIITKLGEQQVGNVQDYMKALNQFNKGETGKVKLLREGKEMELSVTF